MVMYTFGQWIKIYRHLTVGQVTLCPQQLLQTVIEHDKYNSHQNNSYMCFFPRIKVILHYKKIQISMAYIFVM